MLRAEMLPARSNTPGPRRRPTLFGQATACLGVALIGLLAWLAADPSAHASFHPEAAGHHSCTHSPAGCAHDHGAGADGAESHAEHRCIVTTFAAGATDLPVAVFLICVAHRETERRFPACAIVIRAAPLRRHAPSCGPPARA